MLLPASVIVSHSAGYFAAGTDPQAAGHAIGLLHGDIGGLAVIAAAAVVAVLGLEARSTTSGNARSSVPFRLLAVGQAVAYALMELGERLAQGVPFADALAEPTLRLGLAVQIVVAAVACLLVRITHVVARALQRREPAVAAPVPARWGSVDHSRATVLLRTPCSRRGPPAQLLPL